MLERASRLKCDARGAVAPTIALSLFALIAAGGIAFDYARMASLDTELQNAADQAALAAASQLDGKDGACARAAAAAKDMLVNQTLMANDSSADGMDVTVADEPDCDDQGFVRFYQNIEKTVAADDDSNAKFVEIEVNPREAFFALTPVVAAFSSGDVKAVAFATMSSAICRVPPLMMCNPNEGSDPDFDVSDYIGKGIRLIGNDGGGFYGPGVFGFLESGAGGGASVLRAALGQVTGPGDCVSGDGVDVQPGNIITVRDALNTRFDIYDGGDLNQACANDGALCPPSINTRKDLVQKGSACGFVPNGNGNGWREPDNNYPNLPNTTTPRALTPAEIASVAPMGYPRDICHAFSVPGNCDEGRVGTGTWDRFAYFKSRSTQTDPEYAEVTMTTADADFEDFLEETFGTATPTRYQVYRAEMEALAARLKTNVNAGAGGLKSNSQPVCSPVAGITPSDTEVDRRVVSVAVINCDAEDVGANSTSVTVKKWIDIFLIEPAVARTRTVTRSENSDVYVEIIGQTQNATEDEAVQLVQKSVPTLIE